MAALNVLLILLSSSKIYLAQAELRYLLLFVSNFFSPNSVLQHEDCIIHSSFCGNRTNDQGITPLPVFGIDGKLNSRLAAGFEVSGCFGTSDAVPQAREGADHENRQEREGIHPSQR